MFDNHEELLRNDCHPWCRSTARDEAVRAAEDGRSVPLPTLSEAIASFTNHDAPPGARVSDRQCASSADTGANTAGAGLRTERVTLEITWIPPSGQERIKSWLPSAVLERWFGAPGESVRVVEECCLDRINMGEVIRERDAAIRERDAHKEEYYKLRGERITQALTADRFASAVAEADRLRARVAELEAAAAPAANAGGEAKQEPVAWGVIAGGIVLATSTRSSDAVDMQSEHARVTVVVPLFAALPPARGWLTQEERELILGLTDNDNYTEEGQNIAKALLARSSPPEVVLPPIPDCSPMADYGAAWSDCLSAVREALRQAGVTVTQPLPPGPEANA